MIDILTCLLADKGNAIVKSKAKKRWPAFQTPNFGFARGIGKVFRRKF